MSHDSSLRNNNVSANYIGIEFHLATNNSAIDNNIANNLNFGIQILDANYTTAIGNDFIANGVQAYSNTTSSQFDAGYPAGGNYWSDYTGSDLYSGAYQNQFGSDGIGDTPYSFAVNCTDKYPFVKPSYWQDVGIANLLGKFPPYMKTVLGQNYNDSIRVRVINYGNSLWVSKVALYANTTIIDQKTVTLQGRSFTTLNFSWNGISFAFGNYTIRALISPPQADMNITNNQYIMQNPVTLTIPGDLHSPFFLVNGVDLNTLLVSYGGKPDGSGSRPYNPNCDFYEQGRITGPELNLLLSHYGQHYP